MAMRRSKKLTEDEVLEQAVNLMQLATASPGGRLPASSAQAGLGLSDQQLEQVLDAIGTVADSSTGIRPIVYLEKSDVVLVGDASEVPMVRLSGEGSAFLNEILARAGIYDADAERILGALTSPQTAPGSPGSVKDAEYFGPFYHELQIAIEDGVRCRMSYRSAEDPEPRERVIDPGFIYSERGTVYLVAWDVGQDRQKRYRLDRIDDLADTGCSVERHEFVHDTVQESLAELETRAIISVSDASYLDIREWAGGRRLTVRDLRRSGLTKLADEAPGCIIAEVRYSSEGWLFDKILGAAGEIVLLQPDDLRERFLAYAEGLLGEPLEPLPSETPEGAGTASDPS